MIQTCWNTAYYAPPGVARTAASRRNRRPNSTLEYRTELILTAIAAGHATNIAMQAHTGMCQTSVKSMVALLRCAGKIEIAGKIPGRGTGRYVVWRLTERES